MTRETEVKKRATRADVAAAAGVSEATVSMAMRGLSRVAVSTRARVQAEAARLGYRLDTAAALLAQKRGTRGIEGRLSVAQLGLDRYPRESEMEHYAAGRLGMDLSWFLVGGYPEPRVLSRVLWGRGVRGLVIHRLSWTEEERQRFEWERFSVVKMYRAYPELRVPVVRHSPFDYIMTALHEIFRRGYKRVAALMLPSISEFDDDARFGALLNFKHRRLPEGTSLNWRTLPASASWDIPVTEEDVCWLREQEPDLVLLYHWAMAYPMKRLGWDFTTGPSVAAVLADSKVYPEIPRVAGCDLRATDHMEKTLTVLRDMILRGERGFVPDPPHHVIEPVWLEGETLR